MHNNKKIAYIQKYIDKKIDEKFNKTVYGLIQKKLNQLNPKSLAKSSISRNNRRSIAEISSIAKENLSEIALPQIFGKTDSQIFNSFIKELLK